MSKTSHCLALKKVDGPTGGPSSGGTTTRLRPPTRMLLMPSSKPERNQEAFAAWSVVMQSQRKIADHTDASKAGQPASNILASE